MVNDDQVLTLLRVLEELVGAVERRNELAEREAEVLRVLVAAVRDQSTDLRDIHAAVCSLGRTSRGSF